MGIITFIFSIILTLAFFFSLLLIGLFIYLTIEKKSPKDIKVYSEKKLHLKIDNHQCKINIPANMVKTLKSSIIKPFSNQILKVFILSLKIVGKVKK